MDRNKTARGFWVVAPGTGEIRTETLAASDDVLVRTIATGVSRGTESLVFAGRVPPSQHAAMRAPLMGGAFPFPVKYGYSAVGRTADGGRVFVLHPHQDVFHAPGAMCVQVPDTVPSHRAVLAANMETAVNILWDAAPLVGERILVIGAGVVGTLVARAFCRRDCRVLLVERSPDVGLGVSKANSGILGSRVTVVDVDLSRAPLARDFGCGFASPEDAPAEQELIVHTSASEAGLRLALSRAAFEGRIVEASWYGDREPSVP